MQAFRSIAASVAVLAVLALGCADEPGTLGECDGTCDTSSPGVAGHFDLVAAPAGQLRFAWQAGESAAEYWLVDADAPQRAPLATVDGASSSVTIDWTGAGRFALVTVSEDGDVVGTSDSIAVYGIDRTEYAVDDLEISPEQLRAHVWSPTSGDGHPLILVLHGNHNTCSGSAAGVCASRDQCEATGGTVLDNAAGFDYLARLLAAKGYAVASIDGNALNCGLDRIDDRGHLILDHLALWRRWQLDDGAPSHATASRLDLSHVGLVGHSRGGEAVVVASQLLAERDLDFVDDVSVLSLAPTDHDQPVVQGASLLMVLPGCDGDVRNLSGQYIFSRSASVGGAGDLFQVVVPGTGHNLFNRTLAEPNSVCAPSARLSRQSHEDSLGVLAATFFDSELGAAELPEAALGTGQALPRYQAATGVADDLRWTFVARDRVVVEAGDGETVAGVNQLGGDNHYQGLSPEILHSPGRKILSLFWDSGAPSIRHQLMGFDASSHRALSFQVAVTAPDEGSEVSTDAVVRLEDSAGRTASLRVSELLELEAQPTASEPLHVPRTVRVSRADVQRVNPELDWSSLATFEIDLAESGLQVGLWQYGDLAFSR